VLSTNKLKQQLEELKEELSTTNDPTIRFDESQLINEIEDDIYNIEELLSCPQSAKVKIILSPNPSL
jgi:hypothetical protein